MKLNLRKPLVFFDLETTGINISNDRIIEISMLKVNPDQSKESKTHRVNPEMPIPPQSSAIHGIYDKDVADKPTFKQLAHEISAFMEGADLAGFNSNRFDIPVLVEEFMRVEHPFKLEGRRLIDVQKIFHQMEKRTLEAAYKFYCDKELVDAHQAEADTLATFEVLEAQLDRYDGELENDMDYLHDFSSEGEFIDVGRRMMYNEVGEAVFNFGKYKGRKVEDVLMSEPQYYDWIMRSEFPQHTKNKLTEIKLKMRTQGS